MTKETGLYYQKNPFDVWVHAEVYSPEDLRTEFKELGTSLALPAVKKLFPATREDVCLNIPYIATPTMIEDFAEAWDSEWEKASDFSLAPAFSSVLGRLREAAADSHIDYVELRAFYRIMMVSNLIHSGWRDEKASFEAQTLQNKFNKDFEHRLQRLVKETNSDSWRFFANPKGVQIWSTGQAEVLGYMERTSPKWRKIVHQTQRDLN